MDYNLLGVQKKFGEKDTIGKGISKGAEWCKFKLRSTFQSVVVLSYCTYVP